VRCAIGRPMATKQDRHPKAYFDAAKDYQTAADHLMVGVKGLTTFDPVYFLYAHAVELALKSCLLAHDLNPAKTHIIDKFYLQCRGCGFVGTDDRNQVLVGFLANANKHHEYRYPPPAGPRGALPSPVWVREVVAQLVAEVEPHINAWMMANPSLPVPKRSRLAFGKPYFTTQDPPTRQGP
jgi:hypothetical protein